ncbi:hypothetical protein TNCV_921761 [Trichonephila clavipes]|nr:hypothetical protein TNCV_921761 [Trichonephila clavipes]
MQSVQAHVGIEENETTDDLAKEATKLNSDKLPFVVKLNDINSVAQSPRVELVWDYDKCGASLEVARITVIRPVTYSQK